MNNFGSVLSDKYNTYEDEELLQLIEKGNSEALDFLIYKYRNIVRMKAQSYYLIGADRDDLHQEGMIGLFKAIRDYKYDKSTPFKTFAELCISRQIITAIKTASRQKHIPLNSSVSLDKPIFEEESDRTLLETLYDTNAKDPELLLIYQEKLLDIEKKLFDVLSNLEREVLILYLDGKTYKEISEKLNRSLKAIDNALTRIKRKFERYFQMKDFYIH